MKFNYQARTKEGEIQRGTLEAASKEAALALLEKYGLFVTYLEAAVKPPFYAREIRIFRGISKKDIFLFSRQLAIMFKSGVPLTEALTALAQQTPNPEFREKILKIAESIEGGASFSRALLPYPKEFSSFYVNMVKSGEMSGKLSETLSYLADHLEREYNFIARIRGAMIYPALVFVLFFVIAIVMGVFVIPGLVVILKEVGQEPPWITQMVISLSDIFRKSWWIIILAFLGFIIFIYYFLKTSSGKKFFDHFSLKIPGIGSLLKKIYLCRFAENLSTLIIGGLPIAPALEITGEVVGNEVYKSLILKTRDGVRKGEAISSILERYPEVISPLFIQMVSVGERTGSLDTTLLNIVNFYRQEIDRTVESFLRLLEPILIVFLGVVVGGLALAVLMPLFQTIGRL